MGRIRGYQKNSSTLALSQNGPPPKTRNPNVDGFWIFWYPWLRLVHTRWDQLKFSKLEADRPRKSIKRHFLGRSASNFENFDTAHLVSSIRSHGYQKIQICKISVFPQYMVDLYILNKCFLKILVKEKLSELNQILHIVRYSLDGATIWISANTYVRKRSKWSKSAKNSHFRQFSGRYGCYGHRLGLPFRG